MDRSIERRLHDDAAWYRTWSGWTDYYQECSAGNTCYSSFRARSRMSWDVFIQDLPDGIESVAESAEGLHRWRAYRDDVIDQDS